MKETILIVMATGILAGQGRQSNGCDTSRAIIPAGTPLIVRIDAGMSSKTHDAGDRFTGVLDAAIRIRGTAVADKGTEVYGRVVARKRSLQGDELSLELVSIEGSCEDTLYVSTDPLVRRNEKSVASSAVRTGSTAALGAAIGGVAGGGRGAAIGAAAGGAIGAAGGAGPGRPVEVKAETVLVFRLREALKVEH